MAAPLRYLSYTIDTVLLTAALMLATMLHQYPFVHGWLTVKVLLLVVYVVLGSYALKRGATRTVRAWSFVAAHRGVRIHHQRRAGARSARRCSPGSDCDSARMGPCEHALPQCAGYFTYTRAH